MGFLVPEDFRLEIVQRLPGMTVVRPLAKKYGTNRDRVTFLVRRGGNKRYIGNIRSAQTDESPSSSAISETNALWGQIEIPVHVNLANVPVSKSLLEDSGLDLLNEVLMPEFTSQAAIKEDEQFLVGSGVKEPQGILNGTAALGGPFNSDVATQVSGNATAMTFDAVVNTPYNLAGQYRARNSPSVGWAFTSSTAGALAKLKSSTGEYLWTEMYGNNAVAAPENLRGFKVFETEAIADIAANTYPIIFGDFGGYRIIDRVGMSVERYSDSNTAATDSVIFYLRRRYGGQLAEGYRIAVVKIST